MEAQATLLPGLHAAARLDEIRFNRIRGAAGARQQWDYDTRRLQLGGGYQIGPTVQVKAEYGLTRSDGPDPSDDLFSLQLSLAL